MKKFLAIMSFVLFLGSLSAAYAVVVRPSPEDCVEYCTHVTNGATAFMECVDRCLS